MNESRDEWTSPRMNVMKHLSNKRFGWLSLACVLVGPMSMTSDARVIVEQTVLPGNPVYPAMGVAYQPDQGDRLVVNANHVIPEDLVIQGDTVQLRVRPARHSHNARQVRYLR